MVDLLRGSRAWSPEQVARLEAATLDLEPDYEARLAFGAERHRIVLGLGGIPVGIRTDADGIAEYLLEAFAPFVETSAPVVDLALAECSESTFPFETLQGTLMTYSRGDRCVGKFRHMAGFVDTVARSGRGLVAGQNYRQDLGNYLRFVFDAVTPSLGAVLFHTAGVAHRGRAYLFFGPSTAGKSTLSRLSALHHEIMTDDMLIIRLHGAELRAATCGFWGGETRIYPTKRVDLPVRALFRLRKGSENRLERLSSRQTSLEVLCGVPSVKRTVADQRFLLEFASRVGQQVPAYELAFHKKDDSFWSLIDDLG